MTENGVLLHAKHAFMPNTLGYCGPDDRGRILKGLEEGKGGEEVQAVLKEFEAAYPFLKLISRSTGRDVFDYSVPEAYWIGNGLLERVPTAEYYGFTHGELRGRDPEEVRRVFCALGGGARPHHTFYVMGTYAASTVKDGPNLKNSSAKRIGSLIDDCRISWGRVKAVKPKELVVEYNPVRLVDGRLTLGGTKSKKVLYNRDVMPFDKVTQGDWVSLHWNYACEVLSGRQLRNMAKFTSLDIRSVNELLRKADG